jgi:hypothetical protein
VSQGLYTSANLRASRRIVGKFVDVAPTALKRKRNSDRAARSCGPARRSIAFENCGAKSGDRLTREQAKSLSSSRLST